MGEEARACLWILLSKSYITNVPPYSAYDIPYIIYDTPYIDNPDAYFDYSTPINIMINNRYFCRSHYRDDTKLL